MYSQYFSYGTFFHTINIFRFISEKVLFAIIRFFSHIFFTSLEFQIYAFLFWWPFENFRKIWREMFIMFKILLLLNYSYYSSLWRRYITHMKNRKQLNITIKYIVNCCVLFNMFVLFWIIMRGVYYYYDLLKFYVI